MSRLKEKNNFILACRYNHLIVAKYLYNKYKTLKSSKILKEMKHIIMTIFDFIPKKKILSSDKEEKLKKSLLKFEKEYKDYIKFYNEDYSNIILYYEHYLQLDKDIKNLKTIELSHQLEPSIQNLLNQVHFLILPNHSISSNFLKLVKITIKINNYFYKYY